MTVHLANASLIHQFALSLLPNLFLKLCAFEWLVAVSNQVSLPKVPPAPSLRSP